MLIQTTSCVRRTNDGTMKLQYRRSLNLMRIESYLSPDNNIELELLLLLHYINTDHAHGL